MFVDNALRGLTPIQNLKLEGGQTHHIQLRKPGFEPWVTTLLPGEGLPELIVLKRQAAPPPKSLWKRIFGNK